MSAPKSDSPQGQLDVYVTVEDSYMGKLQEVAERLRTNGFTVGHTLDAIGAITGSVEASKMEILKTIPGVGTVNVSKKYELADG